MLFNDADGTLAGGAETPAKNLRSFETPATPALSSSLAGGARAHRRFCTPPTQPPVPTLTLTQTQTQTHTHTQNALFVGDALS